MSIEQKAGCGIALTLMGEGMDVLGPFGDLAPGERGMAKMLVRSMNEMGREMLSDAFAQGLARQMTAMEVYEGGVKSIFASIGPMDSKNLDSESLGAEAMERLLARCTG